MRAIIVTNTHKNIGSVLDLTFTSSARFYSDEENRLYTVNDFVELDTIDHEQNKADMLADYWTTVSMTIQAYKQKEAACKSVSETS